MSSHPYKGGDTHRKAKPKKEYVPQPVNPTRTGEVKTYNESPLKKEFAVVLVSCNGSTTQMTLHHPIGYSKLGADQWVLTPSESVLTLFARKDHPQAGVYAKERRNVMLTLYSKSDTPTKYDVDDDTKAMSYYGYARNVLVKDARKASKAQWIADHPPTEEDIKKKLASSEKEPESYYLEFLKDPDVAVEGLPGPSVVATRISAATALKDDRFLAFFPSAQTASSSERKQKIHEFNASISVQNSVRSNALLKSCEALYLDFMKDKTQEKLAKDAVKESAYETKSGQPAQFPQKAISALDGKSKEAACDWLMQSIASLGIENEP